MNKNKIIFERKSFCFTGEMADIKRSNAEKEVLTRGAYVSKGVNRQLDYLVIGSIPNPAWKFGNYGNKINDATKLRQDTGKPKLINETEFIDALISTEPKYSGNINEKILFIRFNFNYNIDNDFLNKVDSIVYKLEERYNLYSTKRIYDLSSFISLFDTQENIIDENVLKIEYRIFKHLRATDPTVETINDARNCLTSIDEISGNFSFSEPLEGTSIFMKLFDELPDDLKLERQ